MTGRKTFTILAVLMALFAAMLPASAKAAPELEADSANFYTDNSVRKLKFAWGAELNGGVEMSGHDMSTIGISAAFGLQWQWVRFFGLGAEADIMVDNSSRSFPLSLIFRTDFSRRQRLLFMDLRGGVSLNYLDRDPQSYNPYASGGLGITLAHGRSFCSHLILAYTYVGRDNCYVGERQRKCPGMSYATLRLGVLF